DGVLLGVEGEVGATAGVWGGDGPFGALQRGVLAPLQADHGPVGGGEGQPAVVHLGLQFPAVGEGAGEGLLDGHRLALAVPFGRGRVAAPDAVALDLGAGAEGVAAVAALGASAGPDGDVRVGGRAVGAAVDGDAVDAPA